MRRTLSPLLLLGLPLVLSVLAACGTQPRTRGMPTLLALDGEHYRLSEARAAHAEPLDLETDPRWFGDSNWLPPLPRRIEDLPTEVEGARLSLQTSTHPSGDVLLELTLTQGARTLWREHEHRWTNALPFLFGFYVDGQPLLRTYEGDGKHGGSVRFDPLTKDGGQRTWRVRMTRTSLDALVGPHSPRLLTMVAVFCERQHSTFARMALDGYASPLDQDVEHPFEGAPVLLRSSEVSVAPRP